MKREEFKTISKEVLPHINAIIEWMIVSTMKSTPVS